MILTKFSYKANSASVVTTFIDPETGEEKKRLINRMRWKGFGPIAINFTDKGVRAAIMSSQAVLIFAQVPDQPTQIVSEQRGHADQALLKRLEEVRLA